MIIYVPTAERKNLPTTVPVFDGVRMSREDFLNRSENDSDGYVYEWKDGVLEAREKMKKSERYIFRNINRKFFETRAFADGFELIAEADCHFMKLGSIRRPDIAVFSSEQVRSPDSGGDAPPLVIEILSPSNSIIEEEKKMREYFAAGVKTLWHIYPELKEVRVYTSPKSTKICTDTDVCDALTAGIDLSMTVDEIFKP